MYNPPDVRWDVLIDIMSIYYLCYYHISGLNGVLCPCQFHAVFAPIAVGNIKNMSPSTPFRVVRASILPPIV
jgi:hypothetical protein